ncbi:MAG: Long-chain-fatty-acid--CoA ligase FadD15 [Alphaproteobacteria bacterium MarineAlpha6_Bin4]|nr:MAG: Long-chain-fatty-acid--CoA ligase FadD15 [Alphaproteobacteria bacterium MarineAlpha6_Bin3]PPR38018.1 MAG: Long-chain-fatty-acid--CoA ligase FadD15 [Alphaproteobacteria bacterium MarineAlpha6_Bin4]
MKNIEEKFNWKTLPELFLEEAKKQLDKPLLWNKKNNQYKSYSWKLVRERILLLSSKLIKLGIKKGDKVIIISENNPNWFITDFAIMLAGGVTVPAYTTYTKKDYEYLIKDSKAKIVFVSNKKLFLNFLPAIKNYKQIRNIFSYEKINHDINKKIIFIEELWKEKIKKEDANIKIKEDDPACIIYTSGTSGVPKGVILTHKAIRSNLIGSLDIFEKINFNNERYISFLPLSHSYEHTAGQFMPLLTSSEIFYAENMDKLFTNFKEVNPTYIAAVPRFYEAIYKKILNNFSKKKILEKLFNFNLSLGKKIYLNQKKLLLLTRFFKFFFKIIFDNKIKKVFGTKLKFLVSGGGALSYDVNLFFESIGIKILQGYGLTETSPTVSCNRPEFNKIGTVGPPIKGVEVKIASDGEILVRGDTLMKGYLGKEKETKEKIKNNWLYTGDIGKLDEDNHLIITDRKKDIIVTTGGDNIAPQKIESLFSTLETTSQVLIFGDNKPFLVALVIIKIDKESIVTNIGDEEEKIKLHIKKINKKLSPIEKIRKSAFVTLHQDDINAFLTPTMKIKRNKVYEKYKKIIEELYN